MTVRRKHLLAALAAISALLAVVLLLPRANVSSARAGIKRIVLVSFDTLHVRFTGPYSDTVEYTPNMDALAASGTVFDEAYTRVPITLPAHSSLMTGREPSALGVMVNGDFLANSAETLAEILSRAGFRTGAFVSLGVLKSTFNLAQGFEHYDDAWEQDLSRWYRRADEVFAPARDWIESVRNEPFFVWVHFSDPHEPYQALGAEDDSVLSLDSQVLSTHNLTSRTKYRVPFTLPPGRHTLEWRSTRAPRPDDRRNTHLALRLLAPGVLEPWLADTETSLRSEKKLRDSWTMALENPLSEPIELLLEFDGGLREPPVSELREQYRLEVAYTDRYLGALRDLLLQDDEDGERTLWVLVSDHGEGLRFHGVIGHPTYAFNDQMRAMWVMSGPGIPVGKRIRDHQVLLEDVAPTILDLLDLPSPADIEGRSQTGCWSGEGCRERGEWWGYGASNSRARITALAAYRWPYKLIWHDRRRGGFFDLSQDPWEEHNLGPGYRDNPEAPPEFMEFNRRLEEMQALYAERMKDRSSVQLDKEQLEMLEALGYVDN